jgi:NADH dehydrogenase
MMADIVVAGGGFAGMWAALTAAREIREHAAPLTVALVSRDSFLTIRPRLYEADPQSLRASMLPALQAMGMDFIEGDIEAVDSAGSGIRITGTTGASHSIPYRRLILATGSVARVPNVPGFAEYAFSIDDYASAVRFDAQLAQICKQPEQPGGNAIAIIGGGFTAIELACEMRDRIAGHAGEAMAQIARILLLERANTVGPDLGPGPRPQIEQALADARIELRTGVEIEALRREGIVLADGTSIAASTCVLATGQAPNLPPGLEMVPRDNQGRLQVGSDLRVVGLDAIFAAGDVASARADEDHLAMMSCQHAMPMGKHAGYNAVHDLLGIPMRNYQQPAYVTCLDLGRSGAVFTTGWDRSVQKTGVEAGELKRMVNTQWIYPPAGTREDIHAAAHIDKRAGR